MSRDGNPTDYKFQCRPNLTSALRCLRYPSLCRAFWIDAICINQEDDDEKGAQVRRMAQIFKHAYRVIVWLGPGDPDCSKALEHLEYIGRQVVYTRQCFKIEEPNSAERYWNASSAKIADDEAVAAIRKLGSMEWFQRLCVIQEASLANMGTSLVQRGIHAIPASIFWNAIATTNWNQHFDYRDVHNAVEILDMVVRSNQFVHHVKKGHGRRCLDPRDGVYGLLGISGPKMRLSIRPNYHSAWSPADAFQEVFLAHAEITQRLELMDSCSISKEKNISAPSWVPDWSMDGPESMWIDPYFASSYSCAVWYCTGQNVLETYDLRCGEIVRKSRIVESHDTTVGIRGIAAGSGEFLGDLIQENRNEVVVRNLAAALVMGDMGEAYEEDCSTIVEDMDPWIEVARNFSLLSSTSAPLRRDTELTAMYNANYKSLVIAVRNCPHEKIRVHRYRSHRVLSNRNR